MRIIAGKFRSRQIKSLKGPALRPTSDRLRETLFNVLSPAIEGARFLDIFAGTGAVGIEALSRGASEVVFLENHAPAAKLIRTNLDALEIRAGFEILTGEALSSLQKLADQPATKPNSFNLAFLDPPYAATQEYGSILRFLGTSSLLVPSALVIAEHTRKLELPEVFGTLHRTRVLKQGDAVLSFYKRANE